MKHLKQQLLFVIIIFTFTCLPCAYAEEYPLFSFVQISDTHLSVPYNPVFQDTVINYINSARLVNNLSPKPAFVVNTGDLVANWPENASFYKLMTRAFQVPVYSVPGNHDVGNKISDSFHIYPPYGRGHDYKGSFYNDPNIVDKEYYTAIHRKKLEGYRKDVSKDYYSFDYKNCHFIILNASLLSYAREKGLILTAEEKERKRWLIKEYTKQKEWYLGDIQKAHNKKPLHIFVFLHYSLFDKTVDDDTFTNPGYSYALVEKPERKWLLSTFIKYGVTASFSGHNHHDTKVRDYKGIKLITTGGPMMRLIKVYPDKIDYSEIIGKELKSTW